MRIVAIVFAFLLHSISLADCPPGSSFCPAPAASRPAPSGLKPYQFRAESGNARPWSTVTRIIVSHPGSNKQGVGTGTIIDGSEPVAIVMTAAHVLRSEPVSQITVEIFEATTSFPRSTLGHPIASFAGKEIDRDDVTDVGLVSFRHSEPLNSSPLPPVGWKPSTTDTYLSMGCSKANDPTALADRFTRAFLSNDGFDCLEFARTPVQGRSGGGMFTEDGQLVAVCNAAYTTQQGGLYASTESMRQILDRNGFILLSQGLTAKPPAPPVISVPAPAPPVVVVAPPPPPPVAESPIQVVTPIANDLSNLERDTLILLKGVIAGMGFGGVVCLITLVFVYFRRVRPLIRSSQAPVPSAPASYSPSPEDLTRLLVTALKNRDEQESRAKSDKELLDKIKELAMSKPAAPVPNP